MLDGTGLFEFSQRFPKRFFDVGIAEGHAVSMAAGMAKQGLIPVFAVYSSFLQRAYDMLVHDVALQGLHVVFCVDRAGIVGSDGETHNGVFDVAYLSSVPGMTILCPASFAELRKMLYWAIYEISGPVVVRYPRGPEGDYSGCAPESETLLREGSDLTIVSYGTMINQALAAADLLQEQGVSCDVVKLGCICPQDFEKVLASVRKTQHLLVAEDACRADCVGSQILSFCEEQGIALRGIRLVNVGSGILPHGSVPLLREACGLDAPSLCRAVLEMLRGGEG
jgi:1-deoxy-D-xylulose-5-phosphate synthase